MIAEVASSSPPRVPVESWRRSISRRVSDVALRMAGNVAGAIYSTLGSRAGNSLGILTYHRIAPLVPGVPAPPYNVPPAMFREQLEGLLRRGFCFVSLNEAVACHERRLNLPPGCVVLTFDDCFESVYTHAWPILQELSVPATLFLSTAYLDSDLPFPFDTWAYEFGNRVPADHYRPIRTDQCQEMAASGLMEIGTHTHTHADFRHQVDEFAQEMHIATEIAGLRFGSDQQLFAFPFGNPHAGYASSDLIAAARNSGVSCALTTECTLVDVRKDPLGWGRINVFDWDTSFSIAGKLAGWYDWAPRLKHRLQNSVQWGQS